nr:HD domain-containing protein [Bacteriovorax sp. HI3]
MKAPEWRQNVLLVSDDPEIKTTIAPAFGEETTFIVVNNTEEAMEELHKEPIHVMILDAKTTNPSKNYYEKYYDDKEEIPFIELSQYGTQVNNGMTIILLVNKLLAREGDFARKCGAVLIMDRKAILINRMVYLIGVLRKRTFRTIVLRDLPLNAVFPVDLYHHLSLSNRYLPFLPAGVPFSEDKREKVLSANIRHLYVEEAHLSSFLSSLRKNGEALYYSESLASIRNQFRQWLIQVFDLSSDGMVVFGIELYNKGLDIVYQLEKLICSFPSSSACLAELPYPRWSTLAHSMNCGVYSLIFSIHCQLEPRHEIALAAMIHNIGFSEISQEIIKKKETELTPEELNEYKKHVTYSLELLRKKLIPFTPVMEKIIMHHHENYDGTGFPSGLAGRTLPLPVALVSILSSFDYFNTVKPGEKPISVFEAWQRLREHHGESTHLNMKFHPQLLVMLDDFFMNNKF